MSKKSLTELVKVDMGLGEHKNCLKALKQFPLEFAGVPLDVKAENMIEMLNDCYIKTNEEIDGLFTEDEYMVITSSMRGLLYNSKVSDRAMLFYEVRDGIVYGRLDERFDIVAEELLRKIYNLTEFQSFCVIRKVFEFWSQD